MRVRGFKPGEEGLGFLNTDEEVGVLAKSAREVRGQNFSGILARRNLASGHGDLVQANRVSARAEVARRVAQTERGQRDARIEKEALA
jgi:hypothetical protein